MGDICLGHPYLDEDIEQQIHPKIKTWIKPNDSPMRCAVNQVTEEAEFNSNLTPHKLIFLGVVPPWEKYPSWESNQEE